MKPNRAFTLIEMVIAIAVLFTGIIGIFSLFPASYRMAELSKATTVMTLFGQSKMDELRTIGFSNISLGTHIISQEEIAHLVPDGMRARFRNSTITVTSAGNNPLHNDAAHSVLKKIVLTVQYETRPGRFKTEIFSTYIANPKHG